MAKIATINLLVNADTDGEIADGLNEALRPITHTMGMGESYTSFIIDYQFRELDGDAPAGVQEKIESGNYLEGEGFTGNGVGAVLEDAALIKRANKLAGDFFLMMGGKASKGHGFDESTVPKEVTAWNMAVQACEVLLEKDVLMAKENLIDV